MAQVIIQFPDGIGGRVNNLLGRRWGYTDTITNPVEPFDQIPNPESKTDFNKRKIVEYVKESAVDQESNEAGLSARDAQRIVSQTELDLTPG